MYLARKHINGKIHYSIRESYKDKTFLKSRDLIDLGIDPTQFIVYPGGASFYIRGDIDDQLLTLGVKADNETLERIFFPFLNSRTRRVIEGFTHKNRGGSRSESARQQVMRCETERFHMFDQRRMHYLRFGELDQSKISREPKKIYCQLLDKSRDEIEQLFFEMENDLRPTEKKTYAYVIFDVADHFPGSFSRKFPHALPQDKVDEFFLEEVCRINDDEKFWAGFDRNDRLDDYLVKYVCWFFDNDFEEIRLMQNLFTEWADQHRTFRPPSRASMPENEALSVMGISRRDLSSMTIRSLTVQYRKMAKSIHPDKGGDHEKFIKLNQAYSDLLRGLKPKTGKARYSTSRG
ncbi:MAG: J domain-containing protein [Desulfobacteraceae bacterium]|nr:MAG: J domain-containing protein [Desulfobacteraceae bacterium]